MTVEERLARLETAVSKLDTAASLNDQLSGYYTSIFSGEEIDKAAARILATPGTGAITPDAIGAAPAGFGLGKSVAETVLSQNDDLNTVINNGVYLITAASIINGPTISDGLPSTLDATLIVETGRYSCIVRQWLYPGTQGMQDYILTRCCKIGIWQPWEWVNPQMALGIEYRTIERYMGKPVYIKLVNCGVFAAPGTTKTVTFDDTGALSHVVDFGGEVPARGSTWAIPTFLFGASYEDSSIIQVEPRITSGNGIIYLYTKTRDLTSNTSYVWVKYTKNTD